LKLIFFSYRFISYDFFFFRFFFAGSTLGELSSSLDVEPASPESDPPPLDPVDPLPGVVVSTLGVDPSPPDWDSVPVSPDSAAPLPGVVDSTLGSDEVVSPS
jgi:hypothetical protein